MHKGIISTVIRAEVVSVMMYVILRGCWCDIIVLNVRALTEGKCGNLNDSSYEKLDYVFGQFPKHHIKCC